MDLVRIGGLSELHKALQEFPATVERNILRGGLRAGARVIEDEVKRRAPVDDGDLLASIKVSMRTSSRTGVVRAVIRSGDKKVWYARLVEFGTARHWIKAEIRPQRITRRGVVKTMAINTMNRNAKRGGLVIGGRFVGAQVVHPGSKPHPFMRPAFDSRWREAVTAMAEYIKARIPKEVAKIRRGGR